MSRDLQMSRIGLVSKFEHLVSDGEANVSVPSRSRALTSRVDPWALPSLRWLSDIRTSHKQCNDTKIENKLETTSSQPSFHRNNCFDSEQFSWTVCIQQCVDTKKFYHCQYSIKTVSVSNKGLEEK